MAACIGRRPAQSRFESLEPRRLFSTGTGAAKAPATPTADEQYMLELINRARANPAAEAKLDGISLNEGLSAGTISTAARQPLAFNLDLVAAALGHSNWMIANHLFQHNGPGTIDPEERMKQSGFKFTGSFGWGENIAEEGSTKHFNTTSATSDEETNLFVDHDETDRGHRLNIENASYKEVGLGIATGIFDGYHAELSTQDFAYSGTTSFLTGVAFNDSVKVDHFYEPGEGLSGVKITAKRTTDGKIFSTETWAAGGYTLALSPGTYQISASIPGIKGSVKGGTVTIKHQNVEVNFNSRSAKEARA